ncbi:MAG: arabinan endo-1,5-alpha-L-arabinosidase [Bacteroidota bacterium]|nr:arabinan endo-1,5-alpha-L-arabinosidase [Bacteroidota bacterium]
MTKITDYLLLFLLSAIVPDMMAQQPVDTVAPVAPAIQSPQPLQASLAPHPHFPFDPKNPSVHDPVMIKEGNTYYLFETGMGIGQLTSKDLNTWMPGKPVFDRVPAWINNYLPAFRGHFWAPDILFYQGRYHLFYACSAFAKNTSVIGHASAKTLNPDDPVSGWTDHGLIVQSVPYRDRWNAIDPNIIIDETGTPWMTFGSFWDGIKLVKLTGDLMGIAKPETWYSLCRRPRTHSLDDSEPGDGAVEAPFIFRHGDFYYLFVSYDYCCRGLNSNYNVVVGRSSSVVGPYLDKEGGSLATGGGSIVIKGDDTYAGVGHCAVYHMDDTDYFIAHGYSKAENGASKLVIREIEWDSQGWPILHSLSR